MAAPTFALNHMVAPQMSLGSFFKLGKTLGINQFEIRNDLTGNAILDGTSPHQVRELAEGEGAEIISINALQRFNEWTPAREEEARRLAAYASACGARALVLVPVNDGSGKLEGERQGNLRIALKGLKPILEQADIIGLVEPLGFQICSLRSKKEAVDAIHATNGADRFKLVHDTFHHVLAGEPDIFPVMTGLVHISGVDDSKVSVDGMRDPHRVMVTGGDRLGNVTQIKDLLAQSYAGPFSFEPFSPDVHATTDVTGLIKGSMDFIREKL